MSGASEMSEDEVDTLAVDTNIKRLCRINFMKTLSNLGVENDPTPYLLMMSTREVVNFARASPMLYNKYETRCSAKLRRIIERFPLGEDNPWLDNEIHDKVTYKNFLSDEVEADPFKNPASLKEFYVAWIKRAVIFLVQFYKAHDLDALIDSNRDKDDLITYPFYVRMGDPNIMEEMKKDVAVLYRELKKPMNCYTKEQIAEMAAITLQFGFIPIGPFIMGINDFCEFLGKTSYASIKKRVDYMLKGDSIKEIFTEWGIIETAKPDEDIPHCEGLSLDAIGTEIFTLEDYFAEGGLYEKESRVSNAADYIPDIKDDDFMLGNEPSKFDQILPTGAIKELVEEGGDLGGDLGGGSGLDANGRMRVEEVVVDKPVEYDESQIAKKTVTEGLKTLWALPMPDKYINPYTGLVVKNYPATRNGIMECVLDNSGDLNDIKELNFGIIITQLVAAGIANHEGATAPAGPPANALAPLLTERFIARQQGLAKIVILSALHVYAANQINEDIPWYDSFEAVKGQIVSKNRFLQIMRMICTSGKMLEVCSVVTVGDIRAENNVFKYRLMHIAAPQLVCQAMKSMDFDSIMKFFNPREVAEYRKYASGGFFAQLASGPLSQFCIGGVDPCLGKRLPDDITIADLKPIGEPPYYPECLRYTKAILDATGYPYGNWFQGKKAMKMSTPKDLHFVATIKQTMKAISDQNSGDILTEEEKKIVLFQNAGDRAQRVKNLLDGWLM